MEHISKEVFSLAQLLERGLTHHEIHKKVQDKQLLRLTKGFYGFPSTDARIVNAARFGGVPACLTACELHGLWVPPHQTFHLAIQPKQSIRQTKIKDPTICIVHLPSVQHTVPTVAQALVQVMSRHDAETSLVVAESALNLQLVSLSETKDIIRSLSVRKRRRLRGITFGAQSGSETRVRLYLWSIGLHVRIQVEIPLIGRVDILVGNSLIIECDSLKHHGGAEQYQKDHERDFVAIPAGYTVLRLTYEQIWYQWDITKARISELIARRAHQKQPGIKPTRWINVGIEL